MATSPTISATFPTASGRDIVVTTSGALQTALLSTLSNLVQTTSTGFSDLTDGNNLVGGGTAGAQGADSGVHTNQTPYLTVPVIVQDGGNVVLGTSFDQPTYTDTVVGGSGSSIVLANANLPYYTGAARGVFASNATGNIFDTAGAATLAAVDGTYTVTGYGNGDTYLLGGAASTVTAYALGSGNTATLNGGAAYHAGASDTIFATATDGNVGTDTIFSGGNDLVRSGGENMLFVGSGSPNTVHGGTGADTFRASSSGDLLFTGSGGTLITSGGGHDTIWGTEGGTTASTVFSASNSDELLVFATKGSILIGQGQNTTIDGANSGRGLFFFAQPGFGNETLIGSIQNTPGAYDSFHIGAQTVGTSTITIDNFKVGDRLDLTAFGAADQNTAAKAFAAGQNSFTLSDGTTVTFGPGGHHPGATNSGGYFFG